MVGKARRTVKPKANGKVEKEARHFDKLLKMSEACHPPETHELFHAENGRQKDIAAHTRTQESASGITHHNVTTGQLQVFAVRQATITLLSMPKLIIPNSIL